MKVQNPNAHYRIDAELYDYFEESSTMDADSARRIQEAIMHVSKPASCRKLLDIGSGNGWLQTKCSDTPCRVVSVDLGIKNLKRISDRSGDTALLVCANAENLPFKSGSFDCVIASEILEHVNDPERVVREITLLLESGGKLVVSTPFEEVLRTFLCVHCNQQTPANAHIQSFDRKRHMQIFTENGFASTTVTLLQNKMFSALHLSYAFRFLPYWMWRILDSFCMFIYGKAHTIVISGKKYHR